ncbi:MAG: type II toxin-antitoxin system HicA family toxin [Chloroflexi bacterium]|nr:type II toxin-antitoxin system HicA family toxin [Chloroflexota bacterium]
MQTRQRGSHVFLIHPNGLRTTVALHGRDMSRPMLLAVLKQAELSIEQFIELL